MTLVCYDQICLAKTFLVNLNEPISVYLGRGWRKQVRIKTKTSVIDPWRTDPWWREAHSKSCSLLFQVSEMSCVSSKQDTVSTHKRLRLTVLWVLEVYISISVTWYWPYSSRSELRAAEAIAVGLSKLAPSFNLKGNSIQSTHTSRRLLTPYARGVYISLETENTHSHINTHSS